MDTLLKSSADIDVGINADPGTIINREPHPDILLDFASAEAWELARREAHRSPMGRYGVGAVLLNKRGEILASGCSHRHDNGNNNLASVHAEAHALSRAKHLDLRGAVCLTYTLNSKRNGCSYSSKPCRSCAALLVKRGVAQAIYAVKKKNHHWQMEIDSMDDILPDSCSHSLGSAFARHLQR